MLLALISAGFAGGADAAAGRVDFTTGSATVSGRDGQARPLTRGAELDSGDTIRTGDTGRAQIRFTDGSYVSLQPGTDFAISDYKFDGNDGTERGFFGLLKGAMRTVTGAVGRVNRNAYRVTTPTATVGIRGTGGVIQVNPDGSTLVIGTSGIWSLTNPAGSIDVPAGVSGLAPTEPNTPPSETNTQPQTSTAPVQPEEQGFVQGNQVNPNGTADLGIPLVKPLLSGDGYAPEGAYFAFENGQLIGDDGGESTTGSAVFDAQGRLTEVTFNSNVYKLGPGGSHADVGLIHNGIPASGTDGILAWGRWIGEVEQPGGTAVYGPNEGLHYVIGMPTPVMPTSGTGNYSLIGATRPTDGSSTGTFTGSLSMNFGEGLVSGSFNVVMDSGKGYQWSKSGVSVFESRFSMSNFGGQVTGTGGACTASCACSADVRGFFAGANAERAGAAYRIYDNTSATTTLGAAAFKRDGF